MQFRGSHWLLYGELVVGGQEWEEMGALVMIACIGRRPH